ncbi:MAG: YggT family protein [Thermodesulfobacteriota bacterium]
MVIIQALATVIDTLLYVYSFLIIGRAIISWVSPDPYNPIVNFLYTVTEPVMKYARKIIPPIGGTIDISPIVVLVLIHLIRIAINQLFFDLARSL